MKPWVEITVRVHMDECVHPDLVRDDLVEALDWDDVSAWATDTSPGYSEGESNA